jgi:hypothetical protein
VTICTVIVAKTEIKGKLCIVIFLTCSSNFHKANSTLVGNNLGVPLTFCNCKTAGYKSGDATGHLLKALLGLPQSSSKCSDSFELSEASEANFLLLAKTTTKNFLPVE